MAGRWSIAETEKLCQMREILGPLLERRSQMPDVVGDRRLLRFLRGHGSNVEKACKMFANHLEFRDLHNVDDIRNDILFGHKHKIKTPFDFPCGKKILDLVPQLIISATAMDKKRNPLSTESFGFNPEAILKTITKDEYTVFMIYMLEYKILILEQLAHERELAAQKYAATTFTELPSPYGLILSCFIIRDFHNFGFSHMGSDGKTVMKWILEIAVNNYPETQYKCHMINIPWFFNTIWFFIKNLLDANILSKLTISASGEYLTKLQEDISLDNIPVALGGSFTGYNEEFCFDLSETGPFYYAQCPFFRTLLLKSSQLPMSGVTKNGVPVLKKLITDDYFEADGTKKLKKKKSTKRSTNGSVTSEVSGITDLNSITALVVPSVITESTDVCVTPESKKKNKLFSKKAMCKFLGIQPKPSNSPVPRSTPALKSPEKIRKRSSSFNNLNTLDAPNSESKVVSLGDTKKSLSTNLKGEFAVIDTPAEGGEGGVARTHSLPTMDEFLPVTAPIVAPETPKPKAPAAVVVEDKKEGNCFRKLSNSSSPASSVCGSIGSASNEVKPNAATAASGGSANPPLIKPVDKLKPLPGESIKDWQARNRQAAIDRMAERLSVDDEDAQSLFIRNGNDLPTFHRTPTLQQEAVNQSDERMCVWAPQWSCW